MSTIAPDALLFIAPGCPHCPVVLQGLSELVKEGAIGRLEVINVAVHPERAAELGVRSAPWTRLGPFELAGLRQPAELRQWAERAGSETGMSDYLAEQLKEGALTTVERLLSEQPRYLSALLPLLKDAEAPMQVRLGVGAVLEGYAGRPELVALVDKLGVLSAHADHRVRTDACHYLGLSGDPAARPYLEARLKDGNAEVREVAGEALEELAG